MKKFLPVLLLAVIMVSVLAFTNAGAATYKLGDIDQNGTVLAGDARHILRFSAQLESGWTDLQVMLADVNGKDGVNAADARLALRISAKLEEELTIEIGEPSSDEPSSDEPSSEEPSSQDPVSSDGKVAYEDLPVQIKALLEGKFGMEGTVDIDGITTDANMYTDGTNLKMSVDGKEMGFDGMLTMLIKEEKNLIGKKVKNLYMLNDAAKTYTEINSLTLKAFDMDMDDLGDMTFDLSGFGTSVGAAAQLEKMTLNDVEYDVYTFTSDDAGSVTKMYMNGDKLEILEIGDTDGNTDSAYHITKFVAYPGADAFALPKGYKKQGILAFFEVFENL